MPARCLETESGVASEECFWVFYADVLHRADFAAMLRLQLSRQPAATLGAYRVPDPNRCGIFEVSDDGTVLSFEEKPSRPKGNLAFSGLLLSTQSLLDAIPIEFSG